MGHVAFDIHLDEFAATVADGLHDGAFELLRHIDDEHFDGLALVAVEFLVDDLGLGDLEFETFAAHVFEEDAQVKQAAAGDAEGVSLLSIFDAEGDVGLEFFVKAVTDVSAGDELAILSGEAGKVVDGEDHVEGGFIDIDEGEGFGFFHVGNGVADVDVFNAHDGANVTCFGVRGLLARPRPSKR